MKPHDAQALLNNDSDEIDGIPPASLSDHDLELEIDVLEHDILDIEIQVEDDLKEPAMRQQPGNWRKRARDACRFKKLRLRQLTKEFDLRIGKRPRLVRPTKE